MPSDLSGQQLAHYALLEVIGQGGMSVVYRALDTRLDRPVALKVMSEDLSADPEFRGRFAAEAKAASAIDHVNVVPVYDFGEAEGRLYLAMRLVDGTDLSQEIRSGPLPPRRVLNLLGQVGAALDMLHSRGLVHLDVKPANVLITRNESAGAEHVYVADFGLTRRNTRGARTESGNFLGSPSYASPEHLRGGSIGSAADEYSLTCLLFAALSGRAPFLGDVPTVIAGHLSGAAPSLAALTGLPGPIDRVIARGMAGNPSARYPNCADLLAAARKALLGLGTATEPRRRRLGEQTTGPVTDRTVALSDSTTVLPTPVLPTSAGPASAGPQSAGGPPAAGRPPAGPPQARPQGADYPWQAAGPPTGTAIGFGGGPGVPPGAAPMGPSTEGGWMPDGSPLGGRAPLGDPGHRHRATEPHRAWPWLVGLGVLLVIGAVTTLILVGGSERSPQTNAPGSPSGSGSTAPASTTTSPVTTASSSTSGSSASQPAQPVQTPPTSSSFHVQLPNGSTEHLPSQLIPSNLRTLTDLPNPFTSTN